MIGFFTVIVLAALVGGGSLLATEERVLIFSWSVWTWPRRLLQAYKYRPHHRL